MAFEYIVGNLLDSDEPVLAHGCNTKGAFGAGVAGQIAKRWPAAKTAYGSMVHDGSFQIGTAQLVDLLVPGSSTAINKFLFNLGTQRAPGADASSWAIFLSFANMAETCHKAWLHRVAIPRIGCGIGGLEWPEVEKAIDEAISRSSNPNLEIAVYDLPQRS